MTYSDDAGPTGQLGAQISQISTFSALAGKSDTTPASVEVLDS